MERVIALNYVNPLHPTSLGSVKDVHRFYKEYASLKKVRQILEGIPAYTSRISQKRIKIHAPVFAFFKRDLFQVDLVDVSYISRQNGGVKHLLTIIDTASRFLFVIPLKNKSGKYVADKFEEFLKNLASKPKRIHSDRYERMVK